VHVLSQLFHLRSLEELDQAYRCGQFQFFDEYAALTDAKAFTTWLGPLRACEWVIDAKRPLDRARHLD